MLLGQIWTHKTGCSWRSCECVWVYFEGQLKLLFSFLPRHTHILIERRKKKYKFIQFDNSHLLDMSTQHAQRYCPSKSLEYRAISHTSLSCHSVTTPRSSLNRSLLSVSCQSSLPHFSACRRSTVPEQPRIPLNDSSAQHATSAADKFGSIPFLSHLLTSSSSQTTFLSLCFSWFSAIISFYTLTLSSIFSCHISVRVSWVKAAKAHTCFCQINLAIKKKNWYKQQLEERHGTHHHVNASQHLWHIMKAARWKFSLSFSKCDFLEIPRGMYWHSAHSETEAAVWSHCHIIKVCGVLKTSTINDLKWLASTKTMISSRHTDWHHWQIYAPPLRCD